MRNWGRPNVRAQLGESRQLVCGPVSDLQHGLDSSIKFHPVINYPSPPRWKPGAFFFGPPTNAKDDAKEDAKDAKDDAQDAKDYEKDEKFN